MDAGTPRDVFPFFTGCQRSGTTLIRVIFDEHRHLAIPRESHFIPSLIHRRARYERPGGVDAERLLSDLGANERYRRWKLPDERVRRALSRPPAEDLAEAIRRIYAVFAERKRKQRYADKTPRYATEIPHIAGLFPESRFVHVIRDGRDVALSLLEMPWGPTRVDRAALYWRDRVGAALEAGRTLGPGRVMAYRHEDLIEDAETTVRAICAFLDLEFDDRLLRYHEGRAPSGRLQGRNLHRPPTKGLRDFRAQMSALDLRVFELIAGDQLAALGYEPATDPRSLGPGDERDARRRAARAERRHALIGSRAARRALEGPIGSPLTAIYRRLARARSAPPGSDLPM